MVLGKQESKLSQKAVCIIESHGNMLLTKKVETKVFRTQKNTYDGVFVKKKLTVFSQPLTISAKSTLAPSISSIALSFLRMIVF